MSLQTQPTNLIRQGALQAAQRIDPFVRCTPLLPAPQLSRRTGGRVLLKLENRQHTGSFKLRGAMNKLLSLSQAERAAGVIAASTGNHGLAVAHACAQLGTPCTIFLPTSARPDKVAKLRTYPAELQFVPGDALQAELAARQASRQSGRSFLSPYNDLDVIAGQGTVGLELLEQEPDLDAVFVTVGGGGLVSGVAGALKGARPQVEVVGCQPRNSPIMHESVRAGRVLELESLPTLSDGSAGGVEPDAITFGFCQDLVDVWRTVSEEEIIQAMATVHQEVGERIEGAAGVAVAGLLQAAEAYAGRTVAVIICGGNLDPDAFHQITEGDG